jgi:hypothetical protein
MLTNSARALAVTILSLFAPGHLARADSVTGVIDVEWIVATPVFDVLALPEVLSIDSIVVELAHTNGHDLAVSVDGSGIEGDFDFELMFQELAGGSANFSMGSVIENGTLANVAPYTFVPDGGGDFTAPHTPPGLINANTWVTGPLEAQEYALFIVDLNLLFDGGAVGSWTIHYTPIPCPASLVVMAVAGLSAPSRRRRCSP